MKLKHRKKDSLLKESFGYPHIFGKSGVTEAYSEVIYDRARKEEGGTFEFIAWLTYNFNISRKKQKSK